MVVGIKKSCIFAASNENDGALAQLARAFDWQSRGREFDSHTLHSQNQALARKLVSAFSLLCAFGALLIRLLPYSPSF